MTFGELWNLLISKCGGENRNEDDFVNFLQEKYPNKSVYDLRSMFHQVRYNSNFDRDIFHSEYEDWPKYLKEFEIKTIGKKFQYVTTADGYSERLDINDEDVMDEAQKSFLKDFAKRYENHTPEGKDVMRASTCVTKKDPERAAKNQLKAICDNDKFYRRLKAFLREGIVVHDILGTKFDAMNSTAFEKWLAYCCKVYATNDTLDTKEKKIQKAASILSI